MHIELVHLTDDNFNLDVEIFDDSSAQDIIGGLPDGHDIKYYVIEFDFGLEVDTEADDIDFVLTLAKHPENVVAAAYRVTRDREDMLKCLENGYSVHKSMDEYADDFLSSAYDIPEWLYSFIDMEKVGDHITCDMLVDEDGDEVIVFSWR